ncbi:MAG: RES family NAD+ phosphorylase [Desulfobacterales bacterium]
MQQFDSWASYWEFERTVKRENRYFRDAKIEKFLKSVLETSGNRKRNLPSDKYLWRSQHAYGLRPYYDQEEYIDDIEAPCPPERMNPLVDKATEGRANPKGIPYLYLATKKDTAMAEVRPWLGSLISVGQFKTTKDMVLIDCSVHYDRNPCYVVEPGPDEMEQAVWSHIDMSFSKPITEDDKTADYVPTQIIAELFKVNGFDGIMYKSMLEEGHNIVLFDVDSAKLVNCNLYKLDKISFSFNQAANPYTVKENK